MACCEGCFQKKTDNEREFDRESDGNVSTFVQSHIGNVAVKFKTGSGNEPHVQVRQMYFHVLQHVQVLCDLVLYFLLFHWFTGVYKSCSEFFLPLSQNRVTVVSYSRHVRFGEFEGYNM